MKLYINIYEGGRTSGTSLGCSGPAIADAYATPGRIGCIELDIKRGVLLYVRCLTLVDGKAAAKRGPKPGKKRRPTK